MKHVRIACDENEWRAGGRYRHLAAARDRQRRSEPLSVFVIEAPLDRQMYVAPNAPHALRQYRDDGGESIAFADHVPDADVLELLLDDTEIDPCKDLPAGATAKWHQQGFLVTATAAAWAEWNGAGFLGGGS